MSANPSSPTPVRRDIQGLRALAVMAVVLDHAIGWPRGGFVGVDVFFVVSGFLITSLLLREIAATGSIALGAFLARRIRRILPAALVVLATVAAAGFVVFNRPRAEETLGDAIASLFSVVNWRFVADGTDYFAAAAVSPLQHFWSLSVEEQFYLVWPIVLMIAVFCIPAARRRGCSRGVVGVIAVAIVFASFGWALTQSAAAPTAAYFSTATRAWELALGAVLAVAAPAIARVPRPLGALLGWVGLAGVVFAFFVVDPAVTPFPGPGAALPVAAAALMIAGGIGGDPRAKHLFPVTNPVSVFVGDVSYSLYLWHLPVLVFATVLLPGSDPITTAIVGGSIVALTLASYFIVEQPLHRSPLLRRRTGAETTGEAPGEDASTEAPALIAEATMPAPLTSRPAGWVPGTRYYPGSPAALAARASAAPQPAPADRAAARAPSGPPSASHGDSGDSPASVTRPARTDASWAAWRARYGSQMLLSTAGLVIVAGLVVLAVQHTAGALVVAPPAVTGPAAVHDTSDPTPALRAELTAAASATQWPELSPSMDDVIARSSADNPARECFTPGIAIDTARCSWGDPAAANHLYLVGDSIAMSYAPAFKKIAEESGGAWRVTTVGMYGCRFTAAHLQNDGAGVMEACPQRKADVRAMILADAPQLVVLSNAYTLGRTVDGRDLSAADLAASAAAETAGYGVDGRIVYLAPPPTGADLGRCYSPVTAPAGCLTGVDSAWHEIAAATEASATASGDLTISSLPFSCIDQVCPAFAGRTPTKYDPTHLTVAYAERIAPVLRWNLRALGAM